MYINKEEQQIIDIFKELLDKYDKQGTRSVRDGHTRVSVFGRQCRFNLNESFPLLTHRQLFVRGIFEELMWMLKGQTNNQILKDKNVHIWDLWEGQIDKDNPTELGKIYGHMWRNFGEVRVKGHSFEKHIEGTHWKYENDTALKGFDQIEWVINEIKTNPTSSRLIVSGWDPHISTQTPKEAVLPCCHLLFQFFVEDMTLEERKSWVDNNYEGGGPKAISDHSKAFPNQYPISSSEVDYKENHQNVCDFVGAPKAKLSCQLYQRSSDCSTASGYNIAAYSLLTHMIAQQCDLDVGEFVWSLGDVHFYGNQVEDVRIMSERQTYPFPQIKIKKAKDIYSYEWSDIEIIGYQHSGKIENLKVSL